MPNPPITRALLQGFEDRNIAAICTEVRFNDNKQNHCAHFVNHVLGFDFPLTCGGLLNRPGAAANIRVHETFAQCPEVGEFASRPDAPCLAFVTRRSAVNLAARNMTNIPEKHIGIFCDGEIWHYANVPDKVVHQTPEAFAQHFSGSGFALFFGTFPTTARAFSAPVLSHADPPLLQRGQSDNPDVAVWQQFLILQNLLFGLPIRKMLDGDFGGMTEEATEAFQVAAGMEASGKVDLATNQAAIARGFIPRTSATRRKAIEHVTSAISVEADEVRQRLGPTRVFYTEELIEVDGAHLIARLEPHKHTTGTSLRYWHRGITVYSG